MTAFAAGRRVKAGLTFVCLMALIFFFTSGSQAQQTRELVVIIDVSTSMHDLFDEARVQAKQFVSSARLGDRVTIITFGEASHLMERSRIRTSYDVARILSVIDELQAIEYSTNLPGGMERGVRELRQFYERDPENKRVLMWLSDDKSNPPKNVEELITFSTLKKRHEGGLPDRNWFEFRAPIESEADSEIDWFIKWISRSKMHLGVELITLENLGTLLSPDLERELRVRFMPGSEAVNGTTFSVVAELTDQGGGKPYSEAVPIFPHEIICRGSPWEETFRILFPTRPGKYLCRVSFVLPSDKLLVISPPQHSMRVKVQAEIRKLEKQIAKFDAAIAAAYEKSRLARDPTDRGLAVRERAELARQARESQLRTSLIFGPIGARGQYEVTAPLTPTRNLPLESIDMEKSFKLPRGLELRPAYRIVKGKLLADLLLTASEELELRDGWEMQGTISFQSTEEGVGIHPSSIPVKFYTAKGATRWGRRELIANTGYDRFTGVLSTALVYVLKGLQWLLAIIAIWFVLYLVRRYGFGATELVGTLDIVRNPGDRKMKPINLRRMGKLRATNSLTVGSNSKADIVISGGSVAEWHAKITTARTGAGTVVFIQPLQHNQILVNEVVYTDRKEIGDKDILTIGEFVFLYRCPDVQRETIVRFADGRSIRGTLISWDIDAPSFAFLPKSAPSLDARMIIEFPELKAVFFIRKTSRFSSDGFFRFQKPTGGRPVEVIFNDGELLEGYMVGEASEWSKRFYLIPKERGEIALVLVERSAAQNVFMRDAFEKVPADLVNVFRTLLGRKGI